MQNEIVYLYLDDIIPNRFQPREVFDEEGLKELAISIKEHGVIQPIIVRQVNNKYEIIAGERRYKASTMAGLTKIPAIIKNLDDKESSKIALIENLQRRDLTPIEEARTYQKILELEGTMTQEELAQTMGKTQSAVSNKLRLLALPEEVQQSLLSEQISERHARSLLNLNDKNQQIKLLDKIISSRMTVKELEKEIKMLREQEPMQSFGVNEATPLTQENTEPVSYTSGFSSLELSPTEVDINKIRENSIDIKPVEKPAADMGSLMKTNDQQSGFKFVPSADEESDDDTDGGVNQNTNQSANNFFGVTPPSVNTPSGLNQNDFINPFLQNEPSALPSSDNDLFGKIEPIKPTDNINMGVNLSEPGIDPFSNMPNNIFAPINENVNNEQKSSVYVEERPTTGSVVSKFLTDIPSISGMETQNNNVNMVMPQGNLISDNTSNYKLTTTDAVLKIRDVVKDIERQGFSINVQELDVMNEYQIIIKINK